MSLEEVAVRACHEVLMEVGFYITDCWLSMRGFRPSAQASPNTPYNLITIIFISSLLYIIINLLIKIK